MKSNGFSYFSLSIPAAAPSQSAGIRVDCTQSKSANYAAETPGHDEEPSKFEGIKTNQTRSIKDKS
jgi:hypothetical protein